MEPSVAQFVGQMNDVRQSGNRAKAQDSGAIAPQGGKEAVARR
jgi:hypothetical protein